MNSDTVDGRLARAALRSLYANAAAILRGDEEALELLAPQAVAEVPLNVLLEVGALSIAEQLRDVADVRHLPASALLRVLTAAHVEMSGGRGLYAAVLQGSAAYLAGNQDLWDDDGLCDLAACPTRTVQAVATVLAATLTWRARDIAADPVSIAERVCLGSVTRDLQTTR